MKKLYSIISLFIFTLACDPSLGRQAKRYCQNLEDCNGQSAESCFEGFDNRLQNVSDECANRNAEFFECFNSADDFCAAYNGGACQTEINRAELSNCDANDVSFDYDEECCNPSNSCNWDRDDICDCNNVFGWDDDDCE